jgi:hypothetical protein
MPKLIEHPVKYQFPQPNHAPLGIDRNDKSIPFATPKALNSVRLSISVALGESSAPTRYAKEYSNGNTAVERAGAHQ